MLEDAATGNIVQAALELLFGDASSAEARDRYRDRAGRFMYVVPFYYRAAIFHFITAGKKSEAQRWIDQMTIKVIFFPSGYPAGFIRDTFKMASKLGSREDCEVRIRVRGCNRM